MFENLKEKLKHLEDPQNPSALSALFRNPDHLPDPMRRRGQVLFLKLLMCAFSNGDTGPEDIELFKTYTFEQCLTESEWQEINDFPEPPGAEDINRIVDDILDEAGSEGGQKLLEAIRDFVAADEFLRAEEKKILSVLNNKSADNAFFGELSVKFGKFIEQKRRNLKFQDTPGYFENPIAPYLADHFKKHTIPGLAAAAARLGLSLVVIHSDMVFHEKERRAFNRQVAAECRVSESEAESIARELLAIPEDHFEPAFLCRRITEKSGREERKQLLAVLFEIARADKVYSPFEDRALRLVGRLLKLDHTDFVEIKEAR